MARRFHDWHEWIDFLKACEVARRIVADPSMVADAQRFVATRILPDPHQRDYAVIWQDLLSRPPAEIAAALTEDSPRGRLLPETRPVFGKGLTSRDVAELIEHVHDPGPDIGHILRAAAPLSGHARFVMVGTASGESQ
jgi:hypothetical protein